jgi:hypothetical protein
MSKPLQILVFPLIVALAILAMFLLVFLSPLLLAMMFRDVYRLRKAVRSGTCVRCRSALGLASLSLADEANQRDALQFTDTGHPFIPNTDAICPSCRTRHTFKSGSLALEVGGGIRVHA